MLHQLIPALPLLVALPTAHAQVLVDSIPYPGQGTGVWGIHVTADTIFLGSDLTGKIRFSDHNGIILGELATPFDFNHGLIRRPASYLIAEDFTTNGAGLYEIDLGGTLLNSWTFPNVIGGPSSGIGDLEADGNAIWYTMYYPDFNTYPFAYAYKWVPKFRNKQNDQQYWYSYYGCQQPWLEGFHFISTLIRLHRIFCFWRSIFLTLRQGPISENQAKACSL